LILLGDGPVLDELKSSNTNGRIHLPGFKENVVDYFAVSDLGVLCSYFSGESFPLCIIECLFAGRPMLATDIGECRDMLSTESGEVAGAVFPLNSGGIADQTLFDIENWLTKLIENTSQQKHLRRVAEQISRKFRIETVAQQYIDLYRQTILK
jgi:glycosyltransferase involved in cell wall biosynthesis